MYIDYAGYERYRMGMPAVIPEEAFPYWEHQAAAEIDARTFQRLKQHPDLLETVGGEVRDCVCAVAEVLYRADVLAEQQFRSGAAGPLASYSNDGESGTYDLTESSLTESGKQAQIRRLIRRHLGSTGLLYTGVFCR